MGDGGITRGAVDDRQGSGAAEGTARSQKATYHAATGGSGTRDQPAVGAGIAEADEVGRRPCGGAWVAGKGLESKVAGRGEAASPRAVSPVPTGQAALLSREVYRL